MLRDELERGAVNERQKMFNKRRKVRTTRRKRRIAAEFFDGAVVNVRQRIRGRLRSGCWIRQIHSQCLIVY